MKSTVHSSSPEESAARPLDHRLAGYFASAGAMSVFMASQADAAVVGTNTSIKFGPANGGPGNIDIPIDLDSDGETEFQLSHHTNSLGENYLELDKSPDENSNFADVNMDGDNNDWYYLVDNPGEYPQALPFGASSGTLVAPPAGLEYEFWQDSSNYLSMGTTRRANRLIDYDSGVDDSSPWNPPPGNGNFVGLGGVPHYLPFQIDFDDAGPVHYGWIGVQITDDATASGELIGYAYETTPLTPITMGAIPEPATIGLAALGGATLVGSWMGRKLMRRS